MGKQIKSPGVRRGFGAFLMVLSGIFVIPLTLSIFMLPFSDGISLSSKLMTLFSLLCLIAIFAGVFCLGYRLRKSTPLSSREAARRKAERDEEELIHTQATEALFSGDEPPAVPVSTRLRTGAVDIAATAVLCLGAGIVLGVAVLLLMLLFGDYGELGGWSVPGLVLCCGAGVALFLLGWKLHKRFYEQEQRQTHNKKVHQLHQDMLQGLLHNAPYAPRLTQPAFHTDSAGFMTCFFPVQPYTPHQRLCLVQHLLKNDFSSLVSITAGDDNDSDPPEMTALLREADLCVFDCEDLLRPADVMTLSGVSKTLGCTVKLHMRLKDPVIRLTFTPGNHPDRNTLKRWILAVQSVLRRASSPQPTAEEAVNSVPSAKPIYVRLRQTADGPFRQFDYQTIYGYGYEQILRSAQWVIDTQLNQLSAVTVSAISGAPEKDFIEGVRRARSILADCPEIARETGVLAIAGLCSRLKTAVKIVWFNQTRVLRLFVAGTPDEAAVTTFADDVAAHLFTGTSIFTRPSMKPQEVPPLSVDPQTVVFLAVMAYEDESDEPLDAPDYTLHLTAGAAKMLQNGAKLACSDLPKEYTLATQPRDKKMHLRLIKSRNTGKQYLPLGLSCKELFSIFTPNVHLCLTSLAEAQELCRESSCSLQMFPLKPDDLVLPGDRFSIESKPQNQASSPAPSDP